MQNNFDNVSQFQTQSTSVATHKVLSQTYALLGVSLFPTVIGALMGMAMNWGWAAGLGIMFPILMIAGLFGMFYLIRANRNSSLGVVFLMILTFLMVERETKALLQKFFKEKRQKKPLSANSGFYK